MGTPKPHSRWRHHNGNEYEVVTVANLHADAARRDQYPVTIVYRGDNDRVWSRPLSDWHHSMTEIPSH